MRFQKSKFLRRFPVTKTRGADQTARTQKSRFGNVPVQCCQIPPRIPHCFGPGCGFPP